MVPAGLLPFSLSSLSLFVFLQNAANVINRPGDEGRVHEQDRDRDRFAVYLPCQDWQGASLSKVSLKSWLILFQRMERSKKYLAHDERNRTFLTIFPLPGAFAVDQTLQS